jgi:hypothetical protein
MTAENVALVRCRSCAFENRRGAASCFICGESLDGAAPVAARERPGGVAPTAAARKRPGVSGALDDSPGRSASRLTPIMLAIAVIVVALGLARFAPGLAGVFAIIGVVALFATVAAVEYHETWLNGLAAALLTLAALVIVTIAGFAAFFATCVAIVSTSGRGGGEFSGGGNVLGGVCLGGIVGVAAASVSWKLIMRRFR